MRSLIKSTNNAVRRSLQTRSTRSFSSVMGGLNPQYAQTSYRIKDPKVSLPMYLGQFQMTLLDRFDFAETKTSHFYLGNLEPGETHPLPGTAEAHDYVFNTFNRKRLCLELIHHHGTENLPGKPYEYSNQLPNRAFGHIAFLFPDVNHVVEQCYAIGHGFFRGGFLSGAPDLSKKIGATVVFDPDGYQVGILAKTQMRVLGFGKLMTRVGSENSLKFYQEVLGMDNIKRFDSQQYPYTNFTMRSPREGDDEDDDMPKIQLIWNYGTEKEADWKFHNGNEAPLGFAHNGFLIDDVQAAQAEVEKLGLTIIKRADEGPMTNTVIVQDPYDGYHFELIQRGAAASW